MDPVSVLSEVELQAELDIFANAQFNFDIKKEKKKSQYQPNMHSLLNVKLASLAENNDHTAMSPVDAIAKFYDESPDCTPPNGYYSPNPSPPNGFYSPNPTPPNGIHLSVSPSTHAFQDILNPPIVFYDKNTPLSKEDKKPSQSAPLSKEDKRRRNTAASARFRVKKKLREQALQQTADEMTQKAKAFETRVHELEQEVKWLKALIVEKKDGRLEQLLMQQLTPSFY
ncbi:uncharacterized protein B0P05DRAFT_460821 [Gilbertella persicaria]|uniref:uncharacterized protein n=1 Tax=Gilbertella persicaria TaxID=101096 RepID=UPI002220859F|nr:uncharacterized protein B0P05DRAFT_460821 [Gilbertella persicaria]KAI8098154.1 hypothetical protein B0P05DRAFT_460821 [Gilbertella persicaria]